MIKFIDILTEVKQKFNYGCVILYFDFPEMENIQSQIDKNDIYTEEGDRSFGLEKEPHCTLLYGLHEEVTDKQVKDIINKYIYSTCKIYNISLFKNKKYDVLKFDVKGEELKSTNSDLSKLPNTNDFPDYHPHMTIAYLKSGKGRKYTKLFKNQEYELIPKNIVYSKPNGNKNKIKININ